LRALWPWQTETGGLLPPDDQLGIVLLLVIVGASVVLGIMAIETALLKRRLLSPDIRPDPDPSAHAASSDPAPSEPASSDPER